MNKSMTKTKTKENVQNCESHFVFKGQLCNLSFYQFPEGPALLVPQAEVNLALAAIGKGARIAPLDKGAVTWQRL